MDQVHKPGSRKHFQNSHDSNDRRHEDRRDSSIVCDDRRHEQRRDVNQDSDGRRHEERRHTHSNGYIYLSMVGWYCRRERNRRKGDIIE